METLSTESDILRHSQKKYKHNRPQSETLLQSEENGSPTFMQPSQPNSPAGGNISYKDMLVGKCLVSDEIWCDWENDEETDNI